MEGCCASPTVRISHGIAMKYILLAIGDLGQKNSRKEKQKKQFSSVVILFIGRSDSFKRISDYCCVSVEQRQAMFNFFSLDILKKKNKIVLSDRLLNMRSEPEWVSCCDFYPSFFCLFQILLWYLIFNQKSGKQYLERFCLRCKFTDLISSCHARSGRDKRFCSW